MPTATLGFRRLYDALGVGTSAVGEIHHKVTLFEGKTVSVYLGPKPPLGIVCVESDQYMIPGRSCVVTSVNGEYKASAFLEITIGAAKDITEQQVKLLERHDKDTREDLLRQASGNIESAEYLLDVVSGVLGLRFHKQIVLKPLIENCFITGDFEPAASFIGPVVEALENVEANQNTAPHLQRLLDGMTSVPEGLLLKGGATLHWLLRAWRERDAVAKFMYLFVPLEAILQSNNELAVDSLAALESLEELVKNSGAANKVDFLYFLTIAKTRFGPTLSSRFEDFARRKAISGWELDVQAFKKFNRMRNLLLHAGRKKVCSHIDFEGNSRTLEDLVERYVSIALLGSLDVYQSTWRPKRG
ncbi:MAG: hypothetical protein JSS38_02760 [Nitrospira sp.]|nr:hypothetical protein [Nitrospira sp.]